VWDDTEYGMERHLADRFVLDNLMQLVRYAMVSASVFRGISIGIGTLYIPYR